MDGARPDLPWESLVASDEQMYGSRIVRVEGGTGDGIRLLEVWTPSGLQLEFVLDRALDLHTVRFRGQPISWLGPPGLRSRHAYEASGFGWLRTFHGGLLLTCGLEHIGNPATADGSEHAPPDDRQIHHGEHGRISHQGASLDRCEVVRDVQSHFSIVGHVTQAALYGEQFRLRREYRVSLLRPRISLTDTVTNVGPLPTRHGMLYHLNFGCPLVDAAASYALDTAEGRVGASFGPCSAAAPEQVDACEPAADDDGRSHASIENVAVGIRVDFAYATATLPVLLVWRLPRVRANVLGLAPASHRPPDAGEPLEPGSQRTYDWELELSATSGWPPEDSEG